MAVRGIDKIQSFVVVSLSLSLSDPLTSLLHFTVTGEWLATRSGMVMKCKWNQRRGGDWGEGAHAEELAKKSDMKKC